MNIKICYNVEIIGKELEKNGYNFVKLPVIRESADHCTHSTGYYFSKPEISSMKYYNNGFWRSVRIKIDNGEDVVAHSSNLKSNDMSLVRINDNDFISPELIVNDIWIESSDDVVNWLIKHGISMDLLEYSKREFTLYDSIEYPGVPTPSISHGYWAYSSDALVLDEREIEIVLNSIEDKLLREKIKCILYARVFTNKK